MGWMLAVGGKLSVGSFVCELSWWVVVCELSWWVVSCLRAVLVGIIIIIFI